jgi:hypothetical protein
VRNVTEGRIYTILNRGDITVNTKLVLVSALYLKAKWKVQFSPADIRNERFSVNNQKSIEIPMMKKKISVRYVHINELRATAMELPYEGEEVIFFCQQVSLHYRYSLLKIVTCMPLQPKIMFVDKVDSLPLEGRRIPKMCYTHVNSDKPNKR